jgi:hypothetical protein
MYDELKEYGRKQLWPNLRYCLGVCLEGHRIVSIVS